MAERIPPYRPTSEFWAKQMEGPAFAEALREMEPEFQVAREVLRLRLKSGLLKQTLILPLAEEEV